MARTRKAPAPEGGAGFLTTYADMVTLLMAFFVMLFAISSIDQVKFLALLKGLEKDFGNTAYDDLIIEGGASVTGANQPAGSIIPVPGGMLTAEPLAQVVDLQTLARGVESLAGEETGEESAGGQQPDEVAGGATGGGDGDLLGVEQLEEVAESLALLAADAGFASSVDLGFDTRGLVVSLSTDEVLFASGSAVLSRGIAGEFLGPIGEYLATFPNPVYVEGHTDDVPLDRAGYSNWDLSVDRALAVLDYLELDAGIAPYRLSASGYGEYRPRVEGTSAEARQANRRVELVIAFDYLDGFDPAVLVPVPDTFDALVPLEPF